MNPLLLPTAIVAANAAGLACAGAAAYATFVPGSRIWGPVIWRGPRTAPPRVALTFDDGPTAGATDRLLDLLDSMNVRAGFFLIGRNVEREPALARRIVEAGHVIGNHTFDHRRYSSMGRSKFWRDQIARTDAAIEAATGLRPTYFRPPIGHKTPYTMAAAARANRHVVTWSIRGWDGVPTTAKAIVDHILPRCAAGSIIVLHDGSEPGHARDASATLAAVAPLVNGLRHRGLKPVRLDELLGITPYEVPAPAAPLQNSSEPG